ncbi:MAG TPA: SUMF1/EgtB/PvdO family nonheme iron enzyme [Candidatus Accumulibacter phosphatis]|nr:MAG: Serine/threonine-protein kinase pkn1 [Candidatus Accumulibacter sp. SK-11]HRL77253.1 SUMF1/EgtB/PvdO family nonheme iron enzyme [Candidatus Accumulibacter phosphatis]HRQ94618.1 SUMF1/EgtB/PvdO family nonheme iron enzyme [Candidatus Accumulibacter phosphatis]
MKALHTRTAVGRADLLRVYAKQGEQALEQAAAALGYERRLPPETVVASAAVTLSPIIHGVAEAGPPPPERPAVLPAARFFHVTEHRQTDVQTGDDADDAPPWLADAQVLSEDNRPLPGSVRLPAPQPLTRWSRMWPFLRRTLGQTVDSRQPDLPRLVDRLTRGEVLQRIPMHRRHGWSPRIAILADYNRQTQPFHGDFNRLCRALEKRHGELGLDRRVLASEPGRQPLVRRPMQSATQRWQVPPAATPLLILSDLGLLDGTPETLLGWQKFGARLRSAACPALVLCPVPADLHPGSLQRCFELVEWDRHSLLRRSAAGAQPAEAAAERSAAAVEKLLSLLAPAVVVEPPLLRAMRHLLPAAETDVLAEAMLWQHPDVLAGAQGVQFAGLGAIEEYQSRFAQLPPEQQDAAIGLIIAHHAGLPESARLAERAACQRLAPASLPAADAQAIEQWQHAIARTALERGDSPGLQQWLRRHVGRQSDKVLAADEAQAALWALAQRERLARGEVVELPAGVRQDAVRFFLDPEPARQRTACALRQRSEELRLEPLEMKVPGLPAAGSHYADLTLVDGGVFVRVIRSAATGTATSADAYVAAAALPQTLARLTRDVERIELYAPHLDLVVSAFERPPWARALGRDARGLFAEVIWLGQRCRLDWLPPQAGEAGRWSSEQALGVDAFGLFGEISVGGVSQRFRWIAPGRFLMGSPPDEPERIEVEVQHEVTLSRGFWLADTACTQAFWQTVTGSNPSSFKDDPRNPVEQVSWDDVQTFIAELQRRLPGLPVRLPTEAEWEYACRAGTTTPFSFGENITPELVNYDGNYPYAGGEKGLYRQKTVPVASLPANPWGLYEMHGNVYEWCADRYGDYTTEPQVDPQRPQTGDNRVLRGGSWDDFGRLVRSANRSRNEPGLRNHCIGFRLALGPGEEGVSPAEPVTRKGLSAAPTTQRSRTAEPSSTAQEKRSTWDRLTSLFKRRM